jgi:hypothetical protein
MRVTSPLPGATKSPPGLGKPSFFSFLLLPSLCSFKPSNFGLRPLFDLCYSTFGLLLLDLRHLILVLLSFLKPFSKMGLATPNLVQFGRQGKRNWNRGCLFENGSGQTKLRYNLDTRGDTISTVINIFGIVFDPVNQNVIS